MTHSQQIPPYSEESERGVLGSILVDGESVLSMCSEKGLPPEAFYVPAHGLVFRCCAYLAAHGHPVDVLTVSDELRKHRKLDEIGGSVFLDGLIDSTPTSAHADYYVDQMIEKHLLRKLIREGRVAVDKAMTEAGDAKAIIAEHINAVSLLVSERDGKLGKEAAWNEVRKQCVNAQSGHLPGLLTPWSMFNYATGGLPFSMVTVVAGRGGTRKSYLVNQMAVYASVESVSSAPGVYYPLEDGPEAAMRRAACLLANVDSWRYMRGVVDGKEMAEVDRAAQRIISSPLEFIGGRGMTVNDIALDVARGAKRKGWKYAIVDAFKDIGDSRKDLGERDIFISQSLCTIAEKTGVAMIVVHHVKKSIGEDDGFSSAADQRISLLDVTGRTEITHDARMVLILQCKKYRTIEGRPAIKDFVLDCQKNSHGPLGKIDLVLNEGTGRFTEGDR